MKKLCLCITSVLLLAPLFGMDKAATSASTTSAAERNVSEQHEISRIHYSPDDTMIITESDVWRSVHGPSCGGGDVLDGVKIDVWDQKSGELICSWWSRVPLYEITSNSSFVIAKVDVTVDVWNIKTGALMCTLKHDDDRICTVICSKDARRILTVAEHHTKGEGFWAEETIERYARVWDTCTGQLIATLKSPEKASLQDAVLSSDGGHVMIAIGGAVRFWSVDTGQFVLPKFGKRD